MIKTYEKHNPTFLIITHLFQPPNAPILALTAVPNSMAISDPKLTHFRPETHLFQFPFQTTHNKINK